MDLDPAAEVTGRNPAVDVDFDLEFDCDDATTRIKAAGPAKHHGGIYALTQQDFGVLALAERLHVIRCQTSCANAQ